MVTRLAFAFMLFATSVFAQTTYYVSLNGNDAASGTSPASAWRTIGRVNVQQYGPGDQILFQGGQTFNGTLRFAGNTQGTTPRITTVSSFGEGRAAISAGDEDGIVITNAQQLHIVNLRIVGTSLNNRIFNRAGILGREDGGTVASIVIEDVDVSGFSLGGIVFQATAANAIDGVSIFTSSIHENGYAGIGFYGDARTAFRTIDIIDNDIYLTAGFPAPDNRPVEGSGTGIALSGATAATIGGNAIHDSGPFAAGSHGITVSHSQFVTIQANEIWGYHTATADGGGAIDLAGDVDSARILYNYTHANDGAAVRICGCIGNVSRVLVAHNISENDAGRHTEGALTIIGDRLVETIYLLRNTVFAGSISETGGGAVVRVRSLRQEALFAIDFASNIFVTDHRVRMIDVGNSPDVEHVRFIGNIYHAVDGITAFTWRTDTFETLSQWIDVTEQEIFDGRVVGREIDPMLTAPGRGGTIHPRSLTNLTAYRVRTGSPAIDLGIEPIDPDTFGGLITGRRDFYGYAVPARGDIGAHELSPPAPPQLGPALPAVSLAPGQSIALELFVADPDGTEGLTLSVVSGQQYATVTPLTGESATVLITAGPSNPGAPVLITIRARDASGLTADATITLVIGGEAPRGRRRASRH